MTHAAPLKANKWTQAMGRLCRGAARSPAWLIPCLRHHLPGHEAAGCAPVCCPRALLRRAARARAREHQRTRERERARAGAGSISIQGGCHRLVTLRCVARDAMSGHGLRPGRSLPLLAVHGRNAPAPATPNQGAARGRRRLQRAGASRRVEWRLAWLARRGPKRRAGRIAGRHAVRPCISHLRRETPSHAARARPACGACERRQRLLRSSAVPDR